jgi:hypothetical protein
MSPARRLAVVLDASLGGNPGVSGVDEEELPGVKLPAACIVGNLFVLLRA